MTDKPALTREEIIDRVDSIAREWDFPFKPTYGHTDTDIARGEGRGDVIGMLLDLLREIEERGG